MADVSDLLVEIGTEELPPKALTTLERAPVSYTHLTLPTIYSV